MVLFTKARRVFVKAVVEATTFVDAESKGKAVGYATPLASSSKRATALPERVFFSLFAPEIANENGHSAN